jgi:imidazolonepropionase-like amidohydrolase
MRRVARRVAGTLTLLGWMVVVAVTPGQSQELYRRPSLESLEAIADSDGVLPQPFLALTNANVVDVRGGGILVDVTVVLRDGRIESVGRGAPPAGADIVDLRGFYITPGFFEGHYHGSSVQSARRALASGVTTMRSASVNGYSDVAQRDMVKAGFLAGPDILAAGPYVTPELGTTDDVLADPRLYKYANRTLHGEAALREVVRINADNGVDWIKTRSAGLTSSMGGPDPITQVFTDAELVAIVDEAARFDIPVECHAHGIDVIVAAVRAGCRSIEHGSYVDEATLRMMKEAGTIWVPTFISVTGFELPHDDYNSNIARLRWPHLLENMGRMIRLGYELGVTIVTAVDTSYGPESVYRIPGEINAFIDFGMTPIDALRTATIGSATAYGLEDETGAIEAGLDADLLVFDRNPLEQPSVLHNPLLVMSNGRVGVNRQVGLRKILPNH